MAEMNTREKKNKKEKVNKESPSEYSTVIAPTDRKNNFLPDGGNTVH